MVDKKEKKYLIDNPTLIAEWNLEKNNGLGLYPKTLTLGSNKASENGRNNVMHGHIHPRFWYQDDFEELIHFIALLSKHSQF